MKTQYIIEIGDLREVGAICFSGDQAILRGKDGTCNIYEYEEKYSQQFESDLKNMIKYLMNNKISQEESFQKVVEFNSKYKIINP